MKDPTVRFSGVRRTFGRRVALERLDLAVEPGTVLGLVGRNGAGKTTTLRLALGYLHPDAGTIRTFGLDPVRRGRAVRCRAGLLSEESALYPWMTVAEILDFAGSLHPRWDRDLATSFRERLDLPPREKIRTLSRGGRAKVALILAAACRPELLLLDDPTAGLDPLVRREVLEGIVEMIPGQGGAVIYASHLIGDVERVADRVAVLDAGRLTLEGSVEELRRRVQRATAVFESGVPSSVSLPGQIDCRVEGRVLQAVADSEDGALAEALRSLGATRVEVEPLDLEEILVASLRGKGVADPVEVTHV
jgi:ABC-2 type transport system ATP-binding protein